VDWEKALLWLKAKTGAELAPEQAEAVKVALTRKVAVLTGGPGCGKSFTVRSVVELARARKAKVVLAAPTGRAAKRLAELTGCEAATIHRLLKLQPGGDPEFDADNPLDADLVVIDETSMVDVILASKLARAVAPGAHLLLVGDVDQLPSVGAGEVLRDLIGARTLPVVRLTKIFRQAKQSGIVVNAYKVNAGRPPELAGYPDFFWFNCEETEATAALVADIVARRIPARFGLDPRRDVQVLCPVHRGPAGAGNLNLLLQEALPPTGKARPSGAPAAACSASATRSPSCATTTTRAPPGCSTAPPASSPPCRSRTTRSPSAPTRTRKSPTTSTSSTSWRTPTRSPSTDPWGRSTSPS
jgi:exodeoxyribonuclease V alpha subunit